MQTKPSELSDENRTKILEFLRRHPVGVLASVDPEGNPHATTIFISVDDDMNITFTTKRDTRKHENLSHKNKVMLAVCEAATQTAVQVSGEAHVVTDPVEIQKIFQGTLEAARQTSVDIVPPVAKVAAGPYIGYIIKPENIWMNEYGWGDSFANALKHANEPISSGDPD